MGKRKKILVVDDESDFLEVIRIRLEAEGYKVITATNGKEALNKIKRENPDAVLLDILMPKLDGLQTLKRIRKQNENLPVFMLTAFCNEERFKQAKKLKASGFIVKTSSIKKELENITSILKLSDKYRGTKK